MPFDEADLPGELDDEPSEYAEANFERTTWPDVEQEAPVPDIDDDGYSDEDKHTDATRPGECNHHFVTDSMFDMQGYCDKCGVPEQ